MYRVSRLSSTVGWVVSHIPRNQVQLEKEFKSLLKIVFWVAVVAPLILVPLYYLLVGLGV
jgi:hypothetical protein